MSLLKIEINMKAPGAIASLERWEKKTSKGVFV